MGLPLELTPGQDLRLGMPPPHHMPIEIAAPRLLRLRHVGALAPEERHQPAEREAVTRQVYV